MLIEVRLSNVLAAFDGRVLEFFSYSMPESGRYHVATFTGVEIKTDKKGRHTLEVGLSSGHSKFQEIDDKALERARELASAIQQAMAAYR